MRILFFLLLNCSLFAGLHPDYDPHCDSMKAEACPFEKFTDHPHYYDDVVPNKIHRIWIGDQNRLSAENRRIWEDYTSDHGIEYKLWTENDLEVMKTFMLPQNFNLFLKLHSLGQFWAASDVLRMEILRNFGGIYLDCDFFPPEIEGKKVKFSELLSMRGLTVMTEHNAREIGGGKAIFVANGFICAPRMHPVIVSYCEQVYENTENFFRCENCYEAPYVTGPFLFTKILNGTFNVVPWTFLMKYQCYL